MLSEVQKSVHTWLLIDTTPAAARFQPWTFQPACHTDPHHTKQVVITDISSENSKLCQFNVKKEEDM